MRTPAGGKVLRGSVLAPLLFLVYVNERPEGLSSFMLKSPHNAKIARNVNIAENSKVLPEHLDQLQEEVKKWLPEFNPYKCKVTIMGKSRNETTKCLQHI